MKKSIISVLLTLVMVLGLSPAIKAETLTLNGTKAYKYSLEEGIYMMDLTANANTTAQFYTS